MNPILEQMKGFVKAAEKAGLGAAYETEHARLAIQCIQTAQLRAGMTKDGLIKPLPPATQSAADKLYADAAERLCKGLEAVLAADSCDKILGQLWTQSSKP